MNDLKISVVIPFYNTPMEYFMQCVESVKKLNPFEIILADDCSSNLEVVEYAKNSGCKYIKTAYQSGFDGHPFNVGVREAKGDYICRVDSDDMLLELPSEMPCEIHFGNADRVNMSGELSVEQLILAPRAIFNAMVIKKDILMKYMLAEDSNVFGDNLLTLRLLHNKHSFDIHKRVNYIYRKAENSIQTSQSHFQHRLRQIQTVARFCYLENIEPNTSIHYIELAMLNIRYGSKSREIYKTHMLKKKKLSQS